MTIEEKIILAAILKLPKNESEFNILKRLKVGKITSENKQLPTKTALLSAYHNLLKKKRISTNKTLEKLLTRRAVRTLSGVTIVTSLVKPYPCPGQCVYCPLDERMPKSYLSEEPAAMRALTLKFNPYEQMARRIEALENNGHPTDKIELIIKGGTWNSYPLPYQYWFVLESYRGANEVSKNQENELSHSEIYSRRKTRKQIEPKRNPLAGKIKLTETTPLADLRAELQRQQRLNEKSKHRIIGLTLETRPDCVVEKTIWQMREMGTTRIELGVQHTDDTILELTKRGHDSAEAKRAAELLRNFGFKTDFHLMPQLPGATPESDLIMLKTIFSDPGYRPDMIKVYPCSVIKGSELYDWFKAGKYKAYPTEDLVRILKEFKTTVPRYCRISRLIRDIPGQYIEDGNKVTNLRQVIQDQLKKEGRACQCLRCREIGHVDRSKLKVERLKPKLFIDEYETHGGREYFLSFEDKKRQVVFAFCRLRINWLSAAHGTANLPVSPSLVRRGDAVSPPARGGVADVAVGRGGGSNAPFSAYIRELHTYGQLISLNQKNKKTKKQSDVEVQHTGLGKKLVLEAERIAKNNTIQKLAVISGVGVRDYYRKLDYRLEKTYMVKVLK